MWKLQILEIQFLELGLQHGSHRNGQDAASQGKVQA